MTTPGQANDAKPTSFVPNSYCTPNAFVDKIMHLLEPKEWVVLSFVCRHIFGWKDKIESRTAAISISMLVNGFPTSKGDYYFGCGLSRPTVAKVLATLVQYRILEKEGEATTKGQKYHIPDDDSNIDYTGLQQRINDKATKNQKRTVSARKIIQDNKQAGKSDLPVVNATNQDQLMPLTSAGQSDLLNHKHTKPSHNQYVAEPPFPGVLKEIPKPKVSKPGLPSQYGAIFMLIHRFGFNGVNSPAIKGRAGEVAKALLKDDPTATPEEFERFADDWRRKQGRPDFPCGEKSLPTNFAKWKAEKSTADSFAEFGLDLKDMIA